MGLTALYWEDPGRRMVPLADHIGGRPVHWDPSSGMVGPGLAGPENGLSDPANCLPDKQKRVLLIRR